MIKFIDLYKQNKHIENNVFNKLKSLVVKNSFVNGIFFKEFEKNFAKKLNTTNCIGVGNGTDALSISLKCLGIGKGDDVITAANTFIACSEAITLCGAKPVFVDNDEYYGLDADKLEAKINKNTKAVITVHLYGQACDIEKIQSVCNKHNIYLIEDNSQSHFVKYKDRYTGSFGNVACYSFYPGKNLGAWGDAGAITTNNNELANKIRAYSNHGSTEKYKHIFEGTNSRLDDVQALVLNEKLEHIDKWNIARQQSGLYYNQLLENINEIETPLIRSDSDHFFHLYVIKAKFRDELKDFLMSKSIGTGIHYPTALPFLDAYKYLNLKELDYQNAYSNQSKLLSLPICPFISEKEIKLIADTIKSFYKNNC